MAASGVQSAVAGNLTGEQVIATFSGAVLQGTVANDPVAGANLFFNNTSTASFTFSNDVVNNNVASSSLVWGTFTGVNTGFLPVSDLVFVGNNIPRTRPHPSM